MPMILRLDGDRYPQKMPRGEEGRGWGGWVGRWMVDGGRRLQPNLHICFAYSHWGQMIYDWRRA